LSNDERKERKKEKEKKKCLYFHFLLPLSTQLAERRINFKINGQQVQDKEKVLKKESKNTLTRSLLPFFSFPSPSSAIQR